MTGEIVLRQAEMKDAECIVDVMEKAMSTLPNASWFVADDTEFVKRHIDKEGLTLLAVIEEKIAGYLIVRIPKEAADNLGRDLGMSKEERMHVAHMESIAVLPQFRRWKIAGKLLDRGEEIIRQKGAFHLLATIHPKNLASLHNFERLGYHVEKKVMKYGGKERLIVYKDVRTKRGKEGYDAAKM